VKEVRYTSIRLRAQSEDQRATGVICFEKDQKVNGTCLFSEGTLEGAYA